MYNKYQIRKLRITAVHYNLVASDTFWNDTEDLLVHICNGCGPECMSKAGRSHLTNLLSRYSAAYAIHDVDYEEHMISRKDADKRMRRNMIRIWRRDFGFWRWLSLAGIFNRVVVISSSYSAVRQFGEQAWKSTKRRVKK